VAATGRPFVQRNSLPAILLSVVAILVCGAIGVAAGLMLVGWLGLDDTAAAIVAALVGMVVAGGAFALGVAVLKRTGALE